jgi:hypothetical protein
VHNDRENDSVASSRRHTSLTHTNRVEKTTHLFSNTTILLHSVSRLHFNFLDTEALGNDMDTIDGNVLDLRGDEQWQANVRFMEQNDKGYEIFPPLSQLPIPCL